MTASHNEQFLCLHIGLSECMFFTKKEYLFKVIVVGEPGVGKSCAIRRYVHGIFSLKYKATIGVDFANKIIEWDFFLSRAFL